MYRGLSVLMQEFLDKLVQIFHLKGHTIIQTPITLVQLARTLYILRDDLLIPFDVTVLLIINILRCAVFLIEYTLNEPRRK